MHGEDWHRDLLAALAADKGLRPLCSFKAAALPCRRWETEEGQALSRQGRRQIMGDQASCRLESKATRARQRQQLEGTPQS